MTASQLKWLVIEFSLIFFSGSSRFSVPYSRKYDLYESQSVPCSFSLNLLPRAFASRRISLSPFIAWISLSGEFWDLHVMEYHRWKSCFSTFSRAICPESIVLLPFHMHNVKTSDSGPTDKKEKKQASPAVPCIFSLGKTYHLLFPRLS